MIKFKEYFKNNKKKWPEGDGDDSYLKVMNGGYIFEHKRDYAAWKTSNTVKNINWLKDYLIEIVVEKISGVPDYGFGIIWNISDTDQFRYVISDDGNYRVLFKQGEVWHYIIDWTYSKHINQNNGINKLTIIKTEKSIKFYINDIFVARRGVTKFNYNNAQEVGFVIDNRIKINVHSIVVSDDINIKDELDNNSLTKSKKRSKSKDKSLEELKKELNNLIGLNNIKNEIENLTNFIIIQKEREIFGLPTVKNNMHMVFMGPPGTGKTTIARLMGNIYHKLGILKKGHTVEVDRADLVGEWIGQTAPRVDEKIDEAEGGVLFIDEAYSLYVEDSPKDFGNEVIEILIKRMEDESKNFIIIVAGYQDEMKVFLKSNPGLKSRFNRYFYFENYSPAELLEIYKKFASEQKYTMNKDVSEKLKKIIKIAFYSKDKNFGNARYIRNMFEKTIENQSNRLVKLKTFNKKNLSEIKVEDIPDEFIEFN